MLLTIESPYLNTIHSHTNPQSLPLLAPLIISPQKGSALAQSDIVTLSWMGRKKKIDPGLQTRGKAFMNLWWVTGERAWMNGWPGRKERRETDWLGCPRYQKPVWSNRQFCLDWKHHPLGKKAICEKINFWQQKSPWCSHNVPMMFPWCCCTCTKFSAFCEVIFTFHCIFSSLLWKNLLIITPYISDKQEGFVLYSCLKALI